MYIVIHCCNRNLSQLGNSYKTHKDAWDGMRDDLLTVDDTIRELYEEEKDNNGHAAYESKIARFHINDNHASATVDTDEYDWEIFEIPNEEKRKELTF